MTDIEQETTNNKDEEITKKLRRWAEDPSLGDEPSRAAPVWFEDEVLPHQGPSEKKKKKEDAEVGYEEESPKTFWRCGMMGISSLGLRRDLPMAFSVFIWK